MEITANWLTEVLSIQNKVGPDATASGLVTIVAVRLEDPVRLLTVHSPSSLRPTSRNQ